MGGDTVCNLEPVCMTAEQQAAIEAGTLTVEKSDKTEIGDTGSASMKNSGRPSDLRDFL